MISSFRNGYGLPALILVGLASAAGFAATRSTAEEARVIPPPAVDEQAAGQASETAVVAGGCFWGVQGVFQHVAGVTSAVSGYDGGEKATAHYEMTSDGNTGHAESVQITYDPRKITYGRILQVFFSVAHDPTELNRQGPDEGTQYRSAIFPMNDEQARVAKAYIAQLDSAARLQGADRHHDRAGQDLLSRRGLSSGLPGAKSGLSVHRLQRSAEDRQSEAALSDDLPPGPGAGRREVLGLLPSSLLPKGEGWRTRPDEGFAQSAVTAPPVIPAHAGIQSRSKGWMPAFAGMTAPGERLP